MDAAQWPQAIKRVEKRASRPQKELQALINCPRCSSTNTKFCYYNNYSLSQPRYFCKTCRRYWTQGGSLRNVPVGGGSRKYKTSSSSSLSKVNNIRPSDDHNNLSPPNYSSSLPIINPNKISIHEGCQDLNLAYNPSHHHYNINGMSDQFVDFPPFGLHHENKNINNLKYPQNPNFSNTASSSHHHHHRLPAVMEFFKSTTRNNNNNNNNIGSNSVYNSSGFDPAVLHDFKPSLGFSVENGYGNNLRGGGGVEEDDHHAIININLSRNILFPFGELKQVSNSSGEQHEFDHEQDRGGVWNGMLADDEGSPW